MRKGIKPSEIDWMKTNAKLIKCTSNHRPKPANIEYYVVGFPSQFCQTYFTPGNKNISYGCDGRNYFLI